MGLLAILIVLLFVIALIGAAGKKWENAPLILTIVAGLLLTIVVWVRSGLTF